jgi:hypothetical protein
MLAPFLFGRGEYEGVNLRLPVKQVMGLLDYWIKSIFPMFRVMFWALDGAVRSFG